MNFVLLDIIFMVSEFNRKKIKGQKTLGEKLRSARKNLSSDLEFMEKETRVSLKYLQALELDNYQHLPAEVYVLGFLKRYAEFLNLDKDEIIEQYQLQKKLYCQFKISKKNNQNEDIINPKVSDKWLKGPSFVITPKLLVTSLIIFLVLGIFSYIWYQVKGFATAPPLELEELLDDQIVKVESINISGETSSGSNVYINNQAVAVNKDGKFVQEIKLTNGMNSIEITAKNKAEKETKKVIKVLAEY